MNTAIMVMIFIKTLKGLKEAIDILLTFPPQTPRYTHLLGKQITDAKYFAGWKMGSHILLKTINTVDSFPDSLQLIKPNHKDMLEVSLTFHPPKSLPTTVILRDQQ